MLGREGEGGAGEGLRNGLILAKSSPLLPCALNASIMIFAFNEISLCQSTNGVAALLTALWTRAGIGLSRLRVKRNPSVHTHTNLHHQHPYILRYNSEGQILPFLSRRLPVSDRAHTYNSVVLFVGYICKNQSHFEMPLFDPEEIDQPHWSLCENSSLSVLVLKSQTKAARLKIKKSVDY